MKLSWDGRNLDKPGLGVMKLIKILKKGEFQVLEATVSNGNSKSVNITFSDQLDSKQKLKGIGADRRCYWEL